MRTEQHDIQSAPADEPLLSVQDVVRHLGISRVTLYRLLKAGEFVEPIRVGALLRFAPADVRRWLEQNREPWTAP